jgi:hypothetical protein
LRIGDDGDGFAELSGHCRLQALQLLDEGRNPAIPVRSEPIGGGSRVSMTLCMKRHPCAVGLVDQGGIESGSK